jgi:uncharacterized membrane protein YkvA (DUF1232 family)
MSAKRWSDGSPPLEGEILPPEQEAERDAFVTQSFWGKIKAVASRIPFAETAIAAYFCAIDPATPSRVRYTLMGALAYFILPIDVIPDILPIVGFTDDAAVIALAINLVGSHITEAHRQRARGVLASLTGRGKA